MSELSPDWAQGSNFRRYLYFPRPLEAGVCQALAERLHECRHELRPYLTWRHGESGLVLVPERDDLERLILVPGIELTYATTRRDEAHDAALVRAFRIIQAELRRTEHERRLEPYALGQALCDDCGVHARHRSRRMVAAPYPAQDGSPCAPWKGAQYNVIYS